MINKFRGEYNWLSNFAEVQVFYEGIEFWSVENAYVAAKTTDVKYKHIVAKLTASEAKYLGKILPIREDWEEVKLAIMENLLRQKFGYKFFADRLRETGTQEIVECNTWHDNFWGICTCLTCSYNYKQKNNLGKLIMKIRDDLRQPKFFS